MTSGMVVRLWKEGRRILEEEAISVEYDGDRVEVLTEDGENIAEANEWDELTVVYEG